MQSRGLGYLGLQAIASVVRTIIPCYSRIECFWKDGGKVLAKFFTILLPVQWSFGSVYKEVKLLKSSCSVYQGLQKYLWEYLSSVLNFPFLMI